MFFGNHDDIDDFLTDFRIDYLEIPGKSYADAPVRFNYRLSEEENLFMFYFAIIERLSKKIDLPFTMTSTGFATDMQPQFIAIREALVNLLMHSDYFSTQKPRIRVFSDRIEFMNPGGLPKDIESIMKEDFSKPRNPILARIFRSIKLAENAGSGFNKMFIGWNHQCHVNPECRGEIDFYKIVFPLNYQNKPINEPINEFQKQLLEEIKINPNISYEMLAKKLQKGRATIMRSIKNLKNIGVLIRFGSNKTGYWDINKND